MIDGYPPQVWSIVEFYMRQFIENVFNDDPKMYKVFDRIHYVHADTEREYLREVGNIEVLAEEHGRFFQSHLLMEENDIKGFKEYNQCLVSKAEERFANVSGYAGGLAADPLTLEEIDEMIDDKDDDDDDFGDLQ